jgi:ribonuclease D
MQQMMYATFMLQREERWQLAEESFKCLPTIVSLDLNQFSDLFEH